MRKWRSVTLENKYINYETIDEVRTKKNIARKTSGVFRIGGVNGFWSLEDIIQEFFMFLDEVREVSQLRVGETFNEICLSKPEMLLVITRIL